jgi:hypothetical protein
MVDAAGIAGAGAMGEHLGIPAAVSLIDQAKRFLPEMVTNARPNGHTWDEIASAIGTSPEEAYCGSTRIPRWQTHNGPTTSSRAGTVG